MKTSELIPKLVGTASSIETLTHCARLPLARRVFDIVEARMDYISESSHARALKLCARIEQSGTPVIFTLREANLWKKGDEARLPQFQSALKFVSYVDIEVDSLIARKVSALSHNYSKRVIVSYHNYKGTPPLRSLQAAVHQSRAIRADVVKIATLVKRQVDAWILLELLHSGLRGDLCVIGMGARGVALRAFLPVLGSNFAYAHLDAQMAPGQISSGQLCELLRLFSPVFNEHYIMRTGTLEMA